MVAVAEYRSRVRAAVKPRLLDLFCGAGGAAKGYSRAGFEVVGVDVAPQPRYPFEFEQADALDVLREWAWQNEISFDAIHASPPCQAYSRSLKHLADPQPMLIDTTRELLHETGLPWVIENVEGAPLPRQDTLDGRFGFELCGTMFGLRVEHHRLFETNFPVDLVSGCRHSGPAMNPHNKEARARYGWNEPDWAREKGITWTKHKREYRDAIPPVFTQFIGEQLLQHIKAVAA